MRKEPSRTQRALNTIHAHPGIRSPQLAKNAGIDHNNVSNALAEPIALGLVIACKVERGGGLGGPPVTEYRLSSAAQCATAPDWLEWKAHHEPVARPLKPRRENPSVRVRPADGQNHFVASSVTPAGGGGNNTGSPGSVPFLAPPPTEAEAVVEPPQPDIAPAGVRSVETPFLFDLSPSPDDDSDPFAFPRCRTVVCSASTDGQVTIHRKGDRGIVMTADEARLVYQFLGESARIWGKVAA
jgi:hypothetical protein